MENKKYFYSSLNDKERYQKFAGDVNNKFLNIPKSNANKLSFRSENDRNATTVELNFNNALFKSRKVFLHKKVEEYHNHPFRRLNLKIIGEDIKHKLLEMNEDDNSVEDKNKNIPKSLNLSSQKNSDRNLTKNTLDNFHFNNQISNLEGEKSLIKIHLSIPIEDRTLPPKYRKENSVGDESPKKARKIMNKKKKQEKKADIQSKLLFKYRHLQRIKNLCDSNDDDESAEEFDEYVINPETKVILLFDFLIIIFPIYCFFVSTIKLITENCFCSSNPNISFNDILFFINDLLCISDLIIGFFRSYYNFDYKLVGSFHLILKHYLKYDFILDFLSAIPIFSISKYICLSNPNIEKCFKYEMSTELLLLKLCSILKALKINKFVKQKKNQAMDKLIELLSENYSLEKSFIIMINALVYISILHCFVCIHIFLGKHSYSNWLVATQEQNESFYAMYITSLYFFITSLTTVGYGDIVCQSFAERIFQIIILAIGSVLYSYIISSVGNLIKNDSNAKIKKTNDLNMLENIRRDYPNIPFKLYNNIYKYIESKSSRLEKYDANSLIETLPFNLKNNILFTMYKSSILHFKFFKKNENSVFIAKVLNNFIPSSFKKNQILIHEGEMVEEIIFIKDGKISLNAAINLENPSKSINKYHNENFAPFSTEEEKKLVIDNMNNKSYHSVTGEMTYDRAKSKLNNAFKNLENEKLDEKSQFHIQNDIQKNESDFDVNGGAIINDEGDYQYLKIVDIRKNEHFGCVFITLNKPCPLTLQVKSKIIELYLLKKKEAADLSKSYPNIWRKLYQKEFHNLKTIKKYTFAALKKYIEINELLINNSLYDDMMTNDLTVAGLNILEKSCFGDKSIRTYQKSSYSKKDIPKNKTLNYEYDKKCKKINLGAIRVNLKSKKNKNFELRKNSTYATKKDARLMVNPFSKVNSSQKSINILDNSSKKINNKNDLGKENNKISNNFLKINNFDIFKSSKNEDKKELLPKEKKDKLKRLREFLIDCKRYFTNTNIIKESSLSDNNLKETKNNIRSKLPIKKSCLKKKTPRPNTINNYKIKILKEKDTTNTPSHKTVEFNLNNEKPVNSNIIDKSIKEEQILKDLKEICEESTNFSFFLTQENHSNVGDLSISKCSTFEILSSYPNLNKISKGKYIDDLPLQKKLKIILKKYYKEFHENESPSSRTMSFSSGPENTAFLEEYEKLKKKLENKRKSAIMNSKHKIGENLIINEKDEIIQKNKTFYGTHKLNRMTKRKKNLKKTVNETDIRSKTSGRNTNSFNIKNSQNQNHSKKKVIFSTFKTPYLNNEDDKKIENSIKVNKSKISPSSRKSDNKYYKEKNFIDSLDIDIKKNINIYNDAEAEFIIDKNINKAFNEDLMTNKNETNISSNQHKISTKRKRKKDYFNQTSVKNNRNKRLINQMLSIKIPSTNIITNNIITTATNINENKENFSSVEKIKNIESFSIYNIIQKNINKNLNIIDNKESTSEKNNTKYCNIF